MENQQTMENVTPEDINNIIRIQAICRKWLVRKNIIVHIIKRIVPILKRLINAYHDMFSLPLIAELWEEVLHNAICEFGYKTTWTPDRSHKVGEDMRILN